MTFVRRSMALGLVAAVACSAGGAGSLTGDAGASGANPNARDASAGPGSSSGPPSGTSDDDAGRAFPISCAGLCAKAAATLGPSCDAAKCAAQCDVQAQTYASCPSEWHDLLECAVLGGTITSCAFNGKLSIARCSDEQNAVATCAARPRTCTSACKSNADCQNTCPQSSSGLACCDDATGTCFASSTASCPVAWDGGAPPSY